MSMLWSQAKPQYVQWRAAINALIDDEERRIQTANAFALREAGCFMAVMLAALAAMRAGLATVVDRVREATDSIETGSSEIASGNTDLSQRTERARAGSPTSSA